MNHNPTKRRAEAKRTEAKRTETKRTETKRTETKRTETKRTETKRTETKRTETKRTETKNSSARLEQIERRLDALESRLSVDDAEARERRRNATGLDVDLLERLATRDHEEEIGGAVLYAGAVHVGSRRYAWQREHAAQSLIEDIDPEALAQTLFALANPARLRIVLELANGDRSGPELSDIADAGSTGQLYHHLGELLRTGVIGQPKRGVYELRTPALVPMLTIAAAALDLVAQDQKPR